MGIKTAVTLLLLLAASAASAESRRNGDTINEFNMTNSRLTVTALPDVAGSVRAGTAAFANSFNGGVIYDNSTHTGKTVNLVTLDNARVNIVGADTNFGVDVSESKVTGDLTNRVVIDNSSITVIAGGQATLTPLGGALKTGSNLNLGIQIADSTVTGNVTNAITIKNSQIRAIGTDLNLGVAIR